MVSSRAESQFRLVFQNLSSSLDIIVVIGSVIGPESRDIGVYTSWLNVWLTGIEGSKYLGTQK